MASSYSPKSGQKKPRYRGKGNLDPPPPHMWITANIQRLLNKLIQNQPWQRK